MSEPYQNSEYWEERIANETWKTYNDVEEQNLDLLKMYEKTSSSIRRELYALAESAEEQGGLTRTQQYRFDKLLGQQGEIYKEIEKLGENIEKSQMSRMMAAGKNVYKNIMESIGISDFSFPNKREMEQMLRMPWHGSFFSERLWHDMGALERNLNGVINDFISTGKTVTEAAVQLSNVMNRSFNDAHRLVRTETVNYMNRSALRGYKDAGITKVQWWAAKDERTCEICGANHEKKYDIDKAPNLPCHPGCRCTWLPVIESIKDNDKISIEKENKHDTIKAQRYRMFTNGEEVNEFFYYDGEERGLLARQKSTYGIWEKSLSSESKKAFSDYSGAGYDRINSFNRGFIEGDEKLIQEVEHISNAISDFELKEGITVYRGINLDVIARLFPEAEDLPDLVGKTYSDKSFSSTSPLKKVAQKFAEQNGEEGVILQLEIPKGKGNGAYINKLSGFRDDEYEFLLKRNATFEITDADVNGTIPILKGRWKE